MTRHGSFTWTGCLLVAYHFLCKLGLTRGDHKVEDTSN
uniref:Uncharacterized protein n=1 Tax=Anguilla anguilla TaxID=7936 RepID=A0A0E9XQ08_ANGAN